MGRMLISSLKEENMLRNNTRIKQTHAAKPIKNQQSYLPTKGFEECAPGLWRFLHILFLWLKYFYHFNFLSVSCAVVTLSVVSWACFCDCAQGYMCVFSSSTCYCFERSCLLVRSHVLGPFTVRTLLPSSYQSSLWTHTKHRGSATCPL